MLISGAPQGRVPHWHQPTSVPAAAEMAFPPTSPCAQDQKVTTRSRAASPPRQNAHAGRSGALVCSAPRCKVLTSPAAFNDGSFHLNNGDFWLLLENWKIWRRWVHVPHATPASPAQASDPASHAVPSAVPRPLQPADHESSPSCQLAPSRFLRFLQGARLPWSAFHEVLPNCTAVWSQVRPHCDPFVPRQQQDKS